MPLNIALALILNFAQSGAPTAVPDAAATLAKRPVIIKVLANDTDPNKLPLKIESATNGLNGIVAIARNKLTLTYAPAATFFGTDTFNYTITNGHSGTSSAVVTVTVNPLKLPITSITPLTAVQGATGTVLDIKGGPFTSAAKISFGDVVLQNPTITANEIKVEIPGARLANVGKVFVGVTDGVQVSDKSVFSILKAPAAKLVSATPTIVGGNISVVATVQNIGQATGSFEFNKAQLKLGTQLTLASKGIPFTVSIAAAKTGDLTVIFPPTGKAGDAATLVLGGMVNGTAFTKSIGITIPAPPVKTVVQVTASHAFNPKSVTVAAGSVVEFQDIDAGSTHNVTSDTNVAGFSSGTMRNGSTFSWTVPANAVSGKKYFYTCTFHGSPGNGTAFGIGMVGVIIVK
jgi:plastocyanin